VPSILEKKNKTREFKKCPLSVPILVGKYPAAIC
jgi:hypothetical protein